MEDKLSVDEASMFVASVGSYYEAMTRNRWYLPSRKSSIVTVKYLDAVRKGNLWCPKYSDIKTLPCPTPPKKEKLIDIVSKLPQLKEVQLGFDVTHTPDKKWLIDMIATCDPDNEIF